MGKVAGTSSRKADHIRVNLEQDVQSGLRTGLERLVLEHNAVPELSLNEIDTRLDFLGRRLQAPLLVSSMTGGTPRALEINQALAEAAQAAGIAMGLGSQRAALEEPALAATYQVRQFAPDILLFSNLGAVQLNYGYSVDHCRRAVEMAGADALVLHFNALQEALQAEGDVDFSGLLPKIERVCAGLPVPVIAKEVGWGISVEAAQRLLQAGVRVIDVAGAGGTSWSQVEMHRLDDPSQAQTAAAFQSWGIPTALAVRQLRQAYPDLPLIASGGLRSGIDLAKCLALGADLGGMAGPFLRVAAQSAEAVSAQIEQTVRELRISMFASGHRDLPSLKTAKLLSLP
jgi:isopentenyl-diphosphate delta-isomerase